MPEFENPTGYWSYEGHFSVHLMGRDLAAEFAGLPGFSVEKNVVSVGADPAHPGYVKRSMGGFQFRCGEREFAFGYSHVIVLVKSDETPLWYNRDYKGYPLPQ